MGNRIPLILCLCLAVYLVYQRYYYLELLQNMEDKLYISAKQTSDSQKNLMIAEQKIVNLKNVHEEDTLTVSALSKKVKIGEEEQNALAKKYERLSQQYEQLDARFQNLSVIMTETKASYFNKLEKNKADIQYANEQLMKADNAANEYRIKLQTCEQEKGLLNERFNQLRASNTGPENNQMSLNNGPRAPGNINSRSGLNDSPPVNHVYSQRIVHTKIAEDSSAANDAAVNKPVVYAENSGSERGASVQEEPQSSSHSNELSNVPESDQVNIKSNADEKESTGGMADHLPAADDEMRKSGAKGDQNVMKYENDQNADDALGNEKQIKAPAMAEPAKDQGEKGNYVEGDSSLTDSEDPVKEHEDIVEKVNSYLKNNLIEKK